jgi:type I restriction enzyme S subunit
VARKTLNLEQLKSLPVALPPLAEQQEIVACVEGLLAQADALQTRYEALKALIDKLPGALLAKAFRGQLVPQDATEVPVPSAPQPSAEAPARRGPGQQQGLDF